MDRTYSHAIEQQPPTDTRVLYTETCPVCRSEIDGYRKRAAMDDLPVWFDGMDGAADWGADAGSSRPAVTCDPPREAIVGHSSVYRVVVGKAVLAMGGTGGGLAGTAWQGMSGL